MQNRTTAKILGQNRTETTCLPPSVAIHMVEKTFSDTFLLQITYTHQLTHNPRTVTPKTPKLNNLILHCSDQNPMTTLVKATKSDHQRSIIHGWFVKHSQSRSASRRERGTERQTSKGQIPGKRKAEDSFQLTHSTPKNLLKVTIDNSATQNCPNPRQSTGIPPS